jgi:hypothetical protein
LQALAAIVKVHYLQTVVWWLDPEASAATAESVSEWAAGQGVRSGAGAGVPAGSRSTTGWLIPKK